MTLKQILNRKVAVNCRTLSEADEFLSMCSGEGMRLLNGRELPMKEFYNSNVCFEYYLSRYRDVKGITYTTRQYFERLGYKILTLAEIKEMIK
jgi:hypothetical protein